MQNVIADEINYMVSFILNYLILWLFLISTLINFASSISSGSFSDWHLGRKEVTLLSFVMFVSYLLSAPLNQLDNQVVFGVVLTFLTVYFIFDILTMLLIGKVLNFKTNEGRVCQFYLLMGMAINASVFLLLQIWFSYDAKSIPVWVLDFYTIIINLVDVIMVLILILRKDFLGLCKLRGVLDNCNVNT